MSIEFAWDNPNALVTQVTKLLEERGTAIRRGVFELLAIVQELVPKKTTTLVKSITAAVNVISKDLVEGKVGSWLEYARYIEEGTGVFGPMGQPITIVAKNKKALFWGVYDNGKAVMAKHVTIQGMKAQAPFARAIAKFMPRYLEIIQQEVGKLAA